MHIWMNSSLVNSDQGACRTQGCAGTGAVGKRSAQNAINNVTNVMNQTAAQICDTYINNFLASLSRQPSQRDLHYNATIQRIREACVFDVTEIGAGACAFILDIPIYFMFVILFRSDGCGCSRNFGHRRFDQWNEHLGRYRSSDRFESR